ncbi:hypothetical protein IG193_08635 [Infirmifilum lucidum]|uniref:Uncharacterized protein n=1 Tax=Infirmifilum lucidum TaxID=2776706 RepID=A0A7L9FGB9_9CREN|nr:hypothetical protein [Infirmifilum lucidum]QOJ78799.1 hypothetical protein IG193_08635 [Infirmifilum lucidum]
MLRAKVEGRHVGGPRRHVNMNKAVNYLEVCMSVSEAARGLGVQEDPIRGRLQERGTARKHVRPVDAQRQ